MIQRYIFAVLQQALATIASDPSVLVDLFVGNCGLSTEEVAGIQQYFTSHPPKVVQNYAHADAVMPLYAVVLQTEQMSQAYLGDQAGIVPVLPGDADSGCTIVGSIWEASFGILCYAEHPDVVTYMYEIAKTAMLANNGYFVANDVEDVMLSGMDLAPDPRYLPEHLFCRSLTVRAKREQASIDAGSNVGLAFAVTGIAVPTGSPIDPGAVLQNVDPTLGDPNA